MPHLEKARISLRMFPPLWSTPARLEDMLRWVERFRDTIDEVALFTGEIHPPLPLEVIEARSAKLAGIQAKFRELGVRAGINHLATIGHVDEFLDRALNEPWQRMVDINGTAARGSYCPGDPDFLAYTRAAYQSLARAKPDFIWIDDDIRMGNHPPAGHCCFCERCVSRFSDATKQAWTRESLRAAFADTDLERRLHWRRLWLDQHRAVLNELFAAIRHAVDDVQPGLELGWMSCELWYEGFDYDRWFETLSGPSHTPTKARPGGGFWSDGSLSELFLKAHSIGWQTALLPASVTDIQSEHESFPYNRLTKSVHTFGTEVGLYIATGCTGTALNMMGITSNPVEEFLPQIERVQQWRGFYDALVQAFGRTRCRGVWSAYTKDLYATSSIDGDWFAKGFSHGTHGAMREWTEFGLPTAYHPEAASVTLLGGDSALSFTREQLVKILSGSVCMDGRALSHLMRLNLHEHAGFVVARELERDTVEQFTDDPINGRFAHWRRDMRPSFWRNSTTVLEKISPAARVLAQITDVGDQVKGIGGGVFENTLGGRVAVLGYSPWMLTQSLPKSSQLKSLSRWLSREQLPAYVSSFDKIALWCRTQADGRAAMFLLNASLDSVSTATLHVREQRSHQLLRTSGEVREISVVEQDGAYGVLRLPTLGPWEMVLLR